MSNVQRSPAQLPLPAPAGWGGRRRGAGRKRSLPRPAPPHVPRPEHDARHPVHVTLRALGGLPSLRSDRIFATLRRALSRASKSSFRVIHFSVQSDHLHFLVEAEGALPLSRGVQGLAVRCAKAINRALERQGAVWDQRYHARGLTTPREVRAGLVYVLLNFRKHLRAAPNVDPCSSGAWFDGWTRPPPEPRQPSPVRAARTWLATMGWRRGGGAISPGESPASFRELSDQAAGLPASAAAFLRSPSSTSTKIP
jgi:REP element-mobilizing transposase RayT